ncbi:MAG: hypothetical protein H6735_11900 [Alphaproteobacteria bacterium]|nr:hypothetical protein [Alphaproteobacteria bacterium]
MLPLFATAPFGLHLLDQGGQPAPCVELHTTDGQRLVSDETGWVAFDEPGLVDERVWFEVTPTLNYTLAPDALGFRGQAFDVVEGGREDLVLEKLSDPPACVLGTINRDLLLTGATDDPFEILVVDSSGRGVPMVHVTGPVAEYWTDSGGRIAVRDPSLYGRSVTFEIDALHGYQGSPFQATVTEGGSTTTSVVRTNVADRLYRVTGRGIYRDSVLLGQNVPIDEGLLNARVMGQDSVMVVPGQNADVWLYGATVGPGYPVSGVDVAGALARPLADPEDGVNLSYFLDGVSGSPRLVLDVPKGVDETLSVAGPALVDDNGVPKTVVFYAKSDGVDVIERGVTVWNQATLTFEHEVAWSTVAPAVGVSVPNNRGGDVYLEEGFRFPATLEDAGTPLNSWEVYTPTLANGSTDTWPDGSERWTWRLIRDRLDARTVADEDPPVDVATGAAVVPYSDSIAYSPYRHRWQRVFNQTGGTSSLLGDVWYAEADAPTGPWPYAVRIVEHDGYNVYDPYIHAELGSGRRMLFELTMSNRLTTSDPIPRYDYNQTMYALETADVRVTAPIPLYRTSDGLVTVSGLPSSTSDAVIEFLALDHPTASALAVAWDGPACDGGKMVVGGTPAGLAAFYVNPATSSSPGTVSLRRATNGTQEGLFVDVPAGWTPDASPVGKVWPAPARLHNDVEDWLPSVRVNAGADLCADETTEGGGYLAHVDVTSGSSGTTGGTWTLKLDGATVASSPVADITVPAGRHVLVATWTSPDGAAWSDERWFAIAGEPVVTETGDTGLPTDTGDTDVPTTDGVTTDDTDDGGGCKCATPGTGRGAWAFTPLLALLLRRRRRS